MELFTSNMHTTLTDSQTDNYVCVCKFDITIRKQYLSIVALV